MKVEVTKKPILKPFEPVNINITLESEDELLTFWALVNVSEDTLVSNAKPYIKIQSRVRSYRRAANFIDIIPYAIFTKVDDIVKSYNLKDCPPA